MSSIDTPGTPLCPYSDRRTSRELYVKLFIVGFNVLQALFHLISIRRDYGFAAILIIFAVLSPITVAAHLILPVPLAAIQVVYYKGDIDILAQSLAVLIGRILEQDEELPVRYWHPSLRGKISLRAMASLATIAQCIASIWLFSRRARSGTAALYDHYILQLAIVGLLASTLSLLHVFLQPRFPARTWQRTSPEVSWLSLFRPLHDGTQRNFIRRVDAARWKRAFISSSTIAAFLQLTALGSLTTLIAHHCGLDVWWSPLITSAMLTANIEAKFWWLALTGIIIGIILLSVLVQLCFERSLTHEIRFIFTYGFWLIMSIPLSLCLMALLSCTLELTDLLLVAAFHNGHLLLPARPYPIDHSSSAIPACPDLSDWKRIATFSAAAETCPCPLARKDATADWIWALA